ncbi:MAG: hypothetical protein ACLRS8_16430 [Parabacteroides merdae]
MRKVIDIYNTRRPHSSVEMLTPERGACEEGAFKKKMENYL